MIRRALIIGVPNAVGEDPLPGAEIDIATWENFLLTDNAGAWEPSEITTLRNPTRQQVVSAITTLRSTDYSLITFSGHGCHLLPSKGAGFDSLVLGDGSTISEVDLNPGNGKTMLIFDACRHVVPVPGALVKKAFDAAAFAERSESYRLKCRLIFDVNIRAATSGTCTLRACSLNESADEDAQNGGFFTFALSDTAVSWARQRLASRTPGLLTVKDSFDLATAWVVRRDPNQHPIAQLGRRTVHFPFSVAP